MGRRDEKPGCERLGEPVVPASPKRLRLPEVAALQLGLARVLPVYLPSERKERSPGREVVARPGLMGGAGIRDW